MPESTPNRRPAPTALAPRYALRLPRGIRAALADRKSATPPEVRYLDDGQVEITTRVMPFGEFVYAGRPIKFFDAEADEVIENFDRVGADRIPLDINHGSEDEAATPERAESVGWVVGVAKGDGGLNATFRLLPAGIDAIASEKFPFLSPAIRWSAEDEAGNEIGTRLVSVALTNRPFFLAPDLMPRLALSDDGRRVYLTEPRTIALMDTTGMRGRGTTGSSDTPEPHTHEVVVDASGWGSTSAAAGHWHTVQSFAALAEAGHSHSLDPGAMAFDGETEESETGMRDTRLAEWDAAFVNDLPDAAFAAILPGGEKDDDGKTAPRTLRLLPHHGAGVESGTDNDSVDLPHLRNALARVDQIDASDEVKSAAREHLTAHAQALDVGEAAEEDEEETDMTDESKLTDTLRAAIGNVRGVKTDGTIAECLDTFRVALLSEREKTARAERERDEARSRTPGAGQQVVSLTDYRQVKEDARRGREAAEELHAVKTREAVMSAVRRGRLTPAQAKDDGTWFQMALKDRATFDALIDTVADNSAWDTRGEIGMSASQPSSTTNGPPRDYDEAYALVMRDHSDWIDDPTKLRDIDAEIRKRGWSAVFTRRTIGVAERA